MNNNLPKVFIIGLGLIGGSLARAIRREHDVIITAYDVDVDALEWAEKMGVIDHKAASIEEGAKDADFIILASPVGAVLSNLEELGRVQMKADVIITDAASAKKMVNEKAKKAVGDQYVFIGGHPMAGSHKNGVAASDADLFENAFYFLTPDNDVPQQALTYLQDLLKGTRAKFLTLDPETHDDIVGVLSHFPHIVAAALVHHLKGFNAGGMNISQFAAGGFRDITRIASSDPTLWQDIVLHNKDVLLELFHSWDDVMNNVRQQLETGDIDGINRFFYEAKTFRDQFPIKQKGAIPSTNDLYIDLLDRPGEIAKVTALIGDAGISITNIQVIEWREAISGVLRVSFRTAEDRERASLELAANGYRTYLNE
ncbi:MAG: prephenate dehydrogenase [Tuberibacillus sp.]